MAQHRGSSTDILEAITTDSSQLKDLEKEFFNAYVTPRKNHVQPYICDILEKQPERIGKFAVGSVSSNSRSRPVAFGSFPGYHNLVMASLVQTTEN
jgi:hypothetical protein